MSAHRLDKLFAPQSATLDALDGHLPRAWSRANPVDIIGDADAARYGGALQRKRGHRAGFGADRGSRPGSLQQHFAPAKAGIRS